MRVPCSVWSRLRRQAIQRDGAQCLKCGRPGTPSSKRGAYRGVDVHHIVHKEHGGLDELGNLATLCERCHADWHRWAGRGADYSGWLKTPTASVLQALWQADIPPDLPWGDVQSYAQTLQQFFRDNPWFLDDEYDAKREALVSGVSPR